MSGKHDRISGCGKQQWAYGNKNSHQFNNTTEKNPYILIGINKVEATGQFIKRLVIEIY